MKKREEKMNYKTARKKKITKWQQKAITINNNFNVNGPNSQIKRHRVAEWIKNKIYLYSIHKRLTSAIGICKD